MQLLLSPFWFQLKHVIKATASDKTRNKTYAANGCRSENANILETVRGSTRSHSVENCFGRGYGPIGHLYWVVKSRRNRWAGQVASMGARRRIYRVVVEKPRERDNLEDPSVDGRIILRWVFRKWDVGEWAGLIWLRIGTGGGHW
jgi:hypothetical protein